MVTTTKKSPTKSKPASQTEVTGEVSPAATSAKKPVGRQPGSRDPDSLLSRIAALEIHGTVPVSSRSALNDMTVGQAGEEAARLANNITASVARAKKLDESRDFIVESGYFTSRAGMICVANVTRVA